MFARIFEAWCVRWFKRNGWSIQNSIPESIKQYVLIVAPHTSNWDFPVGVAARKLLGLNVRYVAKKELFIWPLRSTLIRLGGYPVDRSKNNSFVDQVVGLFRNIEDFAICVTPEGTRSKVTKWKSGFYHMALLAEVPIIMVGFDYASRKVVLADPFWPTSDKEADFEIMHRFFAGMTPKIPENSQYTAGN